MTALMLAAQQGHTDVVSAILDYGCNANVQNYVSIPVTLHHVAMNREICLHIPVPLCTTALLMSKNIYVFLCVYTPQSCTCTKLRTYACVSIHHYKCTKQCLYSCLSVPQTMQHYTLGVWERESLRLSTFV